MNKPKDLPIFMPAKRKTASPGDSTAHLGGDRHMAAQRMAGFVIANGSMTSNQSGEGEIRRALIEADLVDCMVALPGQFFGSNTQRLSPN